MEKTYGSYEELAKDPNVDVIYLSSPHRFHYEHAMLCIENGKHVLLEKAFTGNADEAKKLFDAAKKHNVFLMEAIWSEFLPNNMEIKRFLSEGIIGEPRMMTVTFNGDSLGKPKLPGTPPQKNEPPYFSTFLPSIYTIHYASMVMGYHPVEIKSVANLVDGIEREHASILMYENGAIVTITTSGKTEATHEAHIYGTKGRMSVPYYWRSQSFSANVYDTLEIFNRYNPFSINGYEYEAQHVMDCIRAGKITSDIATPEKTIAVMEIADEIRRQWGDKFDYDKSL